ncbi:MAG: PIG-L family deacetylase [Acidobacteria bacterium]|nr:PIG-L family deacetylase [Acidobacteriota bacterium]
MADSQEAVWKVRYDLWFRYVEEAVKTLEGGRAIPVGPSTEPLVPPAVMGAAVLPTKVVVCSPHPDDEALIGALPLRLRQETGARVTDCAITLGSNVGQRARRLRELESACRVLDFNLVVPRHPSGFDNINPKTRTASPNEWAEKVETLRKIFDREKPDVIFAPHAEDFNASHIGTHFLAFQALGAHLKRNGRGPVLFIETEFWHELSAPNLMVGVSREVETVLLMATAEHGGEVERNPYHLRHPGRMINNVRRGSEVVGGQGAAAYSFPFAELYRVNFMKGDMLITPKPVGRVVGPTDSIDAAWLRAEFWPDEK